MNLYFFIVCIFLIALLGFQQWMHQREKRDLHNRLMSREYPEYIHYETTHKAQVEAEKKRLEKLEKEAKEKARRIKNNPAIEAAEKAASQL